MVRPWLLGFPPARHADVALWHAMMPTFTRSRGPLRSSRPLLFAVCTLLGLVLGGPAAHADSGRGAERATGYYVALGDSLAAGYQPDRMDDRDRGYVGHVLAAVRRTAPKTTLVNLACSGETSVSFLDGTRCDYREGNQLAAAVRFLHAHGRHTRLITIDIGGNDARRCVSPTGVDQVCYAATLRQLGSNLSGILAQLRAAAPGTPIVVLDYANPYLAAWLSGPAGQEFARGSVAGIAALNAVITGAATAFGAPVAGVAAAYSTYDWTPVSFGDMTIPVNVARICQWTWMCTPYQDIHPNDTGYAVLAAAVVAVLPGSLARAA